MNAAELEAFVERTRLASGVPRFVEDPVAIERIADILRNAQEAGAAEGRERGPITDPTVKARVVSTLRQNAVARDDAGLSADEIDAEAERIAAVMRGGNA